MPNILVAGIASVITAGVVAFSANVYLKPNDTLEVVDSHASHGHSEQAHKGHGKPGADIFNDNSAAYFLDVHEQKEIELSLSTEHTDGIVSVHIEADDGLMLVSEIADWEFEIDGPTKFHLPVTVYGASEGKNYVHIFTTHTDEYGHVTSRAMAQQVDVGVASLETHNYKSVTAAQDPYVTLPAKEAIY